MEPTDPARGAGRGVSLQYSGAPAPSRRASRLLLRQPGVVSESGPRRLRPRVDRRPVHFPGRLPRGPADVAVTVVAARPARAAVVQVLGGHRAAAGAGAAADRTDQRPA